MWSQGYLAWAWCRAGEPHRGIALLPQVVAIQREARFIWSEVYALFLGEGYWLAGEYNQATQTLTELLDIAQRHGMQFLLGAAHRFLGEPDRVRHVLAALPEGEVSEEKAD